MRRTYKYLLKLPLILVGGKPTKRFSFHIKFSLRLSLKDVCFLTVLKIVLGFYLEIFVKMISS